MPRVAKRSAARKPKPRYQAAKRSASAVSGRGAYKRKTYRKRQDDETFGEKAGKFIGGLAQKAVKALTGFGDYEVKNNVLMETNGPPLVENKGKEFIVRHREYIGEVYSSSGTDNGVSAFNVQSFNINPGLSATFPWLTQIASNFAQYRVEGMLFEYKSMYSDAVVTNNGSIGNVILATNYNASEGVFVNKQQMENYEYSQSCKPSCSVIHPVECAKQITPMTELYIRNTGVPANQDIKTYDLGLFQIATQGVPLGAAGAAVDLGELWVTYQIALIKPIIAPYIDSGYAHLTYTAASSAFSSGGLPFASVGSTAFSTSTNIPGITVLTGNQINIPLQDTVMNYIVTCNWYDTTSETPTAGWQGPNIATVTNGAQVQGTVTPTGTPFRTPSASSTATGASSTCLITANQSTAANSFVSINYNSNLSTPNNADVIKVDIIINAVPVGAN